MYSMNISIIIPAHNEEKYLGSCLQSIQNNTKTDSVEIIVVLNRCSDKTEEIAKQYGAITIINDEKNLSAIRNYGIQQAHGEIIITIDADSIMSPHFIEEVQKNIDSNIFIGGGSPIKPERRSLGIFVTEIMISGLLKVFGISAGAFWLRKNIWKELGGFNENLSVAEDIDFALRLKKYAKNKDLKYGTLKKSFITTSCRKFDVYGDWHWFFMPIKSPRLFLKSFFNKKSEFANQYFYSFNDREKKR
ncbi:glycosyl transferase family 2 [Candidatus Peregrinibacteria bacterium]|nr:MAG: glycosyl transferase family 2 [Candidatus Peregrinibacteria bacterium]